MGIVDDNGAPVRADVLTAKLRKVGLTCARPMTNCAHCDGVFMMTEAQAAESVKVMGEGGEVDFVCGACARKAENEARDMTPKPVTAEELTAAEAAANAATLPPLFGTMRLWVGELNQIFFGQVQVGHLTERHDNVMLHNGTVMPVVLYSASVILPDGKAIKIDEQYSVGELFHRIRKKYLGRFPPHGEAERGYYREIFGGGDE